MHYIYFLSAICLTLMLASCEKELDFEYTDIEPLTVIEAELSPEGAKVGITYTTPMDEPMDRTRLTDASVTLADITDGSVFELHPDADGFFTDRTPGIVGHDYRLTVERAGCRYEAETTMYPPIKFESLEFNWIAMPYDHVAVLQGRFCENRDTNGECYWVKIYRNGKIYQWAEMDDVNAEDGICTFSLMTTRKDIDKEDEEDVLYDGDVITCTVSPITRKMHDYLEALQHDSNGPAMFSGDKCLGYFMATSPISESIVFHPDEIPEYK